ncbi:MAG: hypothetical protein ACOVK9_01880, partial [Bacteroidia bacterium]
MKQNASANLKNKKQIFLFAACLLIAIIGFKAYLDLFSPNVKEIGFKKEAAIYIYPSRQLDEVFKQLGEGGFLQNQASFERLAKWVQLNQKLKTGKYILSENM